MEKDVFKTFQFKLLTPRQTLQKLQIALALEKTINISENLLNEICQIIYIFFVSSKIHAKTKNGNYQLQQGMNDSKYLLDNILYQILRLFFLSTSSKK